MEISIREAANEDLEGIIELLKELLGAMKDTEDLEHKQLAENCQALFADRSHYLLVAEHQGKVVGFINFSTRRTCLHSAQSALIDELVVSANYRKQGLGRRLLLAAIEKCKQLGCCEIEVSTETQNTTARKFYSQLGFKEIGVFLERDIE
ncbi:MAG: GNAT family N-acetyltransferase [Candidatus Thermoplasmatota archaeon]